MIHKLIQGGEQYLPFALSKERQLRAMGHLWTAQRYVVDDGTVIAVRIEGENSFIHITGGAKLLSGLVDVGVVESVAEDDGSTSYYMPRFWPRDDFRPTDTTGWLTRGALPAKLANLDLTFNGTSFNEGDIPYPDSRASEYGKRGPASLYSGTMRQVVQVLLSACKGEPKAQWTEEQDRLGMAHGFNNADIPYDYRFSKSHGILTCSDHTKDSHNVWVIEISERGILAWRMRTRKVSIESYPELFETLGYFPLPTRRPIPTDDDQREYRVLMSPTHQAFNEYLYHEGFYKDCGFAFSYTGRSAANISVETIKVPDTELDRTLSVWTNLWTLNFIQEPGEDGVMRPTGVTITRDRYRLVSGLFGRKACDLKFPAINSYEERSLMSVVMPFQYQPYAPLDGSFPVHVFWMMTDISGGQNEELAVYTASNEANLAVVGPSDDVNNFGLRSNIRTLRSGSASSVSPDNVSGPGVVLEGSVDGFDGWQNDARYGDIACVSTIHSRTAYTFRYINISISRVTEITTQGQSFVVPFGEREAIYSYVSRKFQKIEGDVEKSKIIGMPKGPTWTYSNSDIFDDFGVYLGNRRDYYPNGDYPELPTDMAYYTSVQHSYPISPRIVKWVSDGVEIGLISPGLPSRTNLGVFPGENLLRTRRTLRIATSSGAYQIIDRTSQVENTSSPISEDDADFDSQMAFIPPDSMTTKLIDASAEAFSGSLYAMSGINKMNLFVRFIPSFRSGQTYPAASELSYRWCYWVGVPYYTPPA